MTGLCRALALGVMLGLSVVPHLVAAQADPLEAVERRQQELFVSVAPSVVFLSDGHSFGSGFFVNSTGLVLTNAHVVGNSKTVRAVLNDGRELEGRVLKKAESELDLALVQLPLTATKPLTFADSSALRVGAWVASVGHGRGGVWTFNVGMVSNIYPSGGERPVFQTQIPLNPGASGGPIFDRHGQVVGIVTAGLMDSNSINFGIKADVAQAAFRELSGGRVLQIVAPAGVAVFVDGKHVGQGPRVAVQITLPTHEVMAVIGGRMVRRVVAPLKTPLVDLTK